MPKHALYNTWRAMIARCHNPKNPSYDNYGARGVRVCDRWRHSFADFIADVGPRPDGHTLDRLAGDRGYEPGNVRWATKREQALNRFDNHFIGYAGRRLCLSDWAREAGVGSNTLGRRLERGWSMARALSTPPDQRFHPRHPVRELPENPAIPQQTHNSALGVQGAVGE